VVGGLRFGFLGLIKCHHELQRSLPTSDFWTQKAGRSLRTPNSSPSQAILRGPRSRKSERHPSPQPSEGCRQGSEPIFQPSKGRLEPATGCNKATEPKPQSTEPKPEGSVDSTFAQRTLDAAHRTQIRAHRTHGPNLHDRAASRFRTARLRPILESDAAGTGVW
jgi:hypothetical protein